MSDHKEPPAPPPQGRPSDVVEGRDAATWVAIGLSAADLAVNAYNTFKPDNSAPPPPAPESPPAPQIELPPGVDRE